MGQLQVVAPLHHHATEDIAIERDAAFQVADPQDDVIETFDDEGCMVIHLLDRGLWQDFSQHTSG